MTCIQGFIGAVPTTNREGFIEHANKVAEAFRDYEEFCRSLGANAGTAMTFSRAMSSRGVSRDPSRDPSRKQGRRFIGFRLRECLRQEDFDDDADDFSRLI